MIPFCCLFCFVDVMVEYNATTTTTTRILIKYPVSLFSHSLTHSQQRFSQGDLNFPLRHFWFFYSL